MLRRWLLPVAVFVTVLGLHYVWTGYSLRRACAAESGGTTEPCCEPSWWLGYIEPQNYWLGYSYALSLAFAAVALLRYVEQCRCADRNLAIGGATVSGFLAVAGCFLTGCCGSPMLGVYLSLFGASFLPWAKPLIAGLTTVVIGASYCWMSRRHIAGSVAGCCGRFTGGKT